MPDLNEIPIWEQGKFPPIANHRDPEQLSDCETFTRVSMVDVPHRVTSLEEAIDIYSSEATQLGGFGIQVIDQTRVLIPTDDLTQVLEQLPHLREQYEIYGGRLLPRGYYLGSVVSKLPIAFDAVDDRVPAAIHAYICTAASRGSEDRPYVIGDLASYQVTRSVPETDGPEKPIGILFDADLVLRRPIPLRV